jgi:hypothetical protein
MLRDPKGISKGEEAVNLPTGGVSLLLGLNKASNARSDNHSREEINHKFKIDFGADLKQYHKVFKVEIGPNKPTTRLDIKFQGTANQAFTRCGIQNHNTRDCQLSKYLPTTNNHFKGMPQAIVQEKHMAPTLVYMIHLMTLRISYLIRK